MNSFANIRKVIGLSILFVYFVVKIFSQLTFVNQKYFYILDAGHGYVGDDCTNASKVVKEEDGNCFWEWKFNNDVREILSSMLTNRGIKHQFTNNDISSRDMPLSERINIVNNIASNYIDKVILISIHSNAPNSNSENYLKISGFEVYSPTSDNLAETPYSNKKDFSDTIATILMNNIKKQFPQHIMRTKSDQLFKENHYSIISKTNCFAVLSENEFFTNPQIRKMMKTYDFKKKCAMAHFNAIIDIEAIKQ